VRDHEVLVAMRLTADQILSLHPPFQVQDMDRSRKSLGTLYILAKVNFQSRVLMLLSKS